MMDYELTLDKILDRARTLFPYKEIVTKRADGSLHRYTYQDAYERIARLAGGLDDLGVERGERVASLAANHYRHYELYFGPACSGRSLHMANFRLPEDHIVYLFNDAEDRVLFVDPQLLPVVEPLQDRFETVEQYVVLGEDVPDTSLEPVVAYEDLLADQSPDYDWPDLQQDEECGMCYTSGTTGKPKGVTYTHRAIYLHSLMSGHVDGNALGEGDSVLPVVPMFHVNAWGIPYAATLVGSKQVFAGVHTEAEALAGLIEEEDVTVSAAVPTVWINMAEYLDGNPDVDISSIDRLTVGGSAPPESLIRKYREEYDAPIIQGWGMTEMSPLGTLSVLVSEIEKKPPDVQSRYRAKAGVPVPCVDVRVLDDDGDPVPRDGEAFGELQVRGPWVTDQYHNRPDANEESFTDDGWLRTGDVATWDEYGYVDIVDRTKDVIKSGGEWISSVDLENALMAHDAVREAAVIGLRHPEWQERPLACVVLSEGGAVTEEELKAHLAEDFPEWWLPDDIQFLEEIPQTSTGKFDKKVLRDQFQGRYDDPGPDGT